MRQLFIFDTNDTLQSAWEFHFNCDLLISTPDTDSQGNDGTFKDSEVIAGGKKEKAKRKTMKDVNVGTSESSVANKRRRKVTKRRKNRDHK
jgi:hypothetical protein